MRPEDESWFKNDGSYQEKPITESVNAKQAREKTVEMFMADCCELAEGQFTPASTLNEELSKWSAEKARGEVGQRRLLAVLVRLGQGRIERVKRGGIRGLRGVRVVSR